MHDMQSIARDGVAWSVFALVTTVSLAKNGRTVRDAV